MLTSVIVAIGLPISLYGGSSTWRESTDCTVCNDVKQRQALFIHPRCGITKDAANFATCLECGWLDVLLPKYIKFIMVSPNLGFVEISRVFTQFAELSERQVMVLDPCIEGYRGVHDKICNMIL